MSSFSRNCELLFYTLIYCFWCEMTYVSQAKRYLMKKCWLLLLICIQIAPIGTKKSPNVGGPVHSSSKYHESFENSHETSKSIKSSDRNATKIELSGSENEEDQIECSGGENDNRNIRGSTKDENKRQKVDKISLNPIPKNPVTKLLKIILKQYNLV